VPVPKRAARKRQQVRDRNRPPEHTPAPESAWVVAGRHAVAEALRRRQPMTRVLIQEGIPRRGPVSEIVSLAREAGVPCQEVPAASLDRIAGGAGHQGVVAFASAMNYTEFDDLIARWNTAGGPALVALLDGVTDPRNLGAILRSAAAWRVDAVVIPAHRAAGVTPAAAKAAAGTLGLVPVARVPNLPRAVVQLQEAGFWVAAADPRGDRDFTGWDFTGRVGLVLGDEGRGVSRLVRERCDAMLRIPMAAEVESLNVAVAAGLLFYEAFRQRSCVSKVSVGDGG